MLVITATMRAKQGKEQDLIEAMKELVKAVRENEPGNKAYTFHRAQNDAGLFMVYEMYESGEAMREHMSSGHFQAAAKKFPELIEGGLGLDTYEVVV